MTSNSSWLAAVTHSLDGAWYSPVLVAVVALILIALVRATAATRARQMSYARRRAVNAYPGRHEAPPGWKPPR